MDYEHLLGWIEQSDSFYYRGLLAFFVGSISALVVFILDNNIKYKKYTDSLFVFIVTSLGLICAGFGALFVVLSWVANDGEVEDALAAETLRQPIVVVEKHELPRYTNYKLRCGRFDTIAARIPKYADLSGDPVYGISFQDLHCWVHDEELVAKINEAVNRYELYDKK